MRKIKLILIISSIVLLLLTPAMNNLVNRSRAVNGFGGEVLIWIFPIALLGFIEDSQ